MACSVAEAKLLIEGEGGTTDGVETIGDLKQQAEKCDPLLKRTAGPGLALGRRMDGDPAGVTHNVWAPVLHSPSFPASENQGQGRVFTHYPLNPLYRGTFIRTSSSCPMKSLC